TIGVELLWKGKGTKEVGIDGKSGNKMVTIDPNYFRPNEVDYLCGDARKAKRELGWKPKVTFRTLVELMMKSELAQAGLK
ncbi:MAG: GDP-mannose 4,6-dehydratase, partial [bacterium]|nr:GDP-mannose 4,6-dehydratase [bacterium]